jgi:hypothetical protein
MTDRLIILTPPDPRGLTPSWDVVQSSGKTVNARNFGQPDAASKIEAGANPADAIRIQR